MRRLHQQQFVTVACLSMPLGATTKDRGKARPSSLQTGQQRAHDTQSAAPSEQVCRNRRGLLQYHYFRLVSIAAETKNYAGVWYFLDSIRPPW